MEQYDKAIRSQFYLRYNELVLRMTTEQLNEIKRIKTLKLDYITELTAKMRVYGFSEDFIKPYIEMEQRRIASNEGIIEMNDEMETGEYWFGKWEDAMLRKREEQNISNCQYCSCRDAYDCRCFWLKEDKIRHKLKRIFKKKRLRMQLLNDIENNVALV